MARVLGIPVPIERERKFVLATRPNLSDFPVPYIIVRIRQTYLRSASPDAEEERVRRREQNGKALYFRTLKRWYQPGERVETEHQITEAEYVQLLEQADIDYDPIVKRRVCFVWEGQ